MTGGFTLSHDIGPDDPLVVALLEHLHRELRRHSALLDQAAAAFEQTRVEACIARQAMTAQRANVSANRSRLTCAPHGTIAPTGTSRATLTAMARRKSAVRRGSEADRKADHDLQTDAILKRATRIHHETAKLLADLARIRRAGKRRLAKVKPR